ncbi:MAG: type I glyceraldehyde-3-phosphate dehydrogenase [Minisyncoccus archaeiphilus]|jgi:glyceraldehyde 3-phosphate dehydrogenase|uniref:type I glyceraldehyde-3-phosphate dehydrogenase n=1 Tax=Minisyncoccus archaeiphilus TaxID=3238481 RepID=UPI0009CE76D7|nr:MAG: Glyceraldehyde-3-phosphate dehydrogenase [Parcubacteria group bacterium ADurb.Bin216]GMX59725.1 MAG: type I glyceraldehyde-3-phosphate dehydrogenase [Candidatus Parcubacteria bacterium]
MAKKIAINGFGRIGRCVLKAIIEDEIDLEIVAINDLTDAKTLSHLLKYDTVYGSFSHDVVVKGNSVFIDDKEIKLFAEKDPELLPWKDLGIDIVLECTGNFTKREEVTKHLNAGAKRVIISAPAKSDDIPSYVIGVNHKDYKGEEIVDMGSCTTNCLAPIVKVLEEEYGIVNGFMTTVHSYTNDQRVLDLPHSDLRRARTAAENIIPTTTGAAKAIHKVVPTVKGKLDGFAIRVPTPVVSVVDLVCTLKKEVLAEEIIKTFKKKSKSGELKGVLWVEEEPLVSSDFIGNPYSSIVDAEFLKVNKNMVKVLAWYDNEWAYSCRLAELAEFIAKKIKK